MVRRRRISWAHRAPRATSREVGAIRRTRNVQDMEASGTRRARAGGPGTPRSRPRPPRAPGSDRHPRRLSADPVTARSERRGGASGSSVAARDSSKPRTAPRDATTGSSPGGCRITAAARPRPSAPSDPARQARPAPRPPFPKPPLTCHVESRLAAPSPRQVGNRLSSLTASRRRHPSPPRCSRARDPAGARAETAQRPPDRPNPATRPES